MSMADENNASPGRGGTAAARCVDPDASAEHAAPVTVEMGRGSTPDTSNKYPLISLTRRRCWDSVLLEWTRRIGGEGFRSQFGGSKLRSNPRRRPSHSRRWGISQPCRWRCSRFCLLSGGGHAGKIICFLEIMLQPLSGPRLLQSRNFFSALQVAVQKWPVSEIAPLMLGAPGSKVRLELLYRALVVSHGHFTRHNHAVSFLPERSVSGNRSV